MEILFEGFVELRDGSGLKTVLISRDGGYTNAWVDDAMADDVTSAEEFAESYGNRLYKTVNAFRSGGYTDVEDVWNDI